MAKSGKPGILSGLRNLALRAVAGGAIRPILGSAGAPFEAMAAMEFVEAEFIEMVWIPPGEFLMGSPESEAGRGRGEIQHKVTLTQGFWMGKYPVTQGEWQKVMGTHPSHFKGSDRLPVEQVSWDDCQKFIEKLNRRTALRYRLPTEAEWEYACRAGTTTPFSFGETISTDQANYDGNHKYGNGVKGVYRGKTTEVGSFPPNVWALHDMHGNVWEWCQDQYGPYSITATTDPKGPSSGQYRVLRGGSWRYSPFRCRAARRYSIAPDHRDLYVGLRLVRTS